MKAKTNQNHNLEKTYRLFLGYYFARFSKPKQNLNIKLNLTQKKALHLHLHLKKILFQEGKKLCINLTTTLGGCAMGYELRAYQAEAVQALRQSLAQGNRRPILQLPTGGGKTVIALAIIHRALEKIKRVLFLAPRRELIYQAAEKFISNHVDTGVIMAGERLKEARVQVASFDTLHARCMRSDRMALPDADMVVVDEAHLSITKTRLEILNYYNNKIVIGLTATPARGDGRGLGVFYDDLVLSWPIAKLIEHGFLSPVRYYAPSKPDLQNLKLGANGDYREKDLGIVMDKVQLIGDIVHNWKRIAKGKSTVVFCSTKAHSRHVCEAFRAAGYPAEHVDSDTPNDDRAAILRRVRDGRTLVLCNVYVASYGLDIPGLECAVMARPTKSLVLYMQTIGRILRPSSETGKTQAIVIDHSGCVDEHGFVDDPIPWSLDGSKKISDVIHAQKQETREPKEITCGDCGTVFRNSRVCPMCGYEMIGPGKDIPTHQANLQEVKQKKSASEKRNRLTGWDEKIYFMGGLKYYATEKNYSDGWIAHKYRARFSVWPHDNRLKSAPAVPPGEDILNFIRSQNIRYHKSRKHENIASNAR